MVKKESKQICSVGVAFVFLSSFLSMFFGMGTYFMFNVTGNDSYIAAIIGSILSIGIFFIFRYIYFNNTEENIYDLTKKLYGKGLGTFINLLFFLAFIVISAIVLFNLSNFLNVEYLPDTNENFIKAIILVTIIYISSKSLSEIVRVNQIFSYINIFLIVVDICGLFSKINFKYVEPINCFGKTCMLKSIFIYVTLSIVPYMMLLITSKKNIIGAEKDKTMSVVNRTVLLTNILQIVIILMTILILGKDFINVFRFPEYIALKQFTLFNILERVENILALNFYFNSISFLSFLFYYMINFLPDIKIKKWYSVIISVVLIIITSLVFIEGISFASIVGKYIYYVILVGIMLPILLIFTKMIISAKKAKKTSKYIAKQV